MNIMTGVIKFMFSKKSTKIDEIFTVDLMVTVKLTVNFRGLLWKREI